MIVTSDLDLYIEGISLAQAGGSHQLNKSMLVQELNEMKGRSRGKRKAYWAQQQNIGQALIEGRCPGKCQTEIVDPAANTEAVFQDQLLDSQNESPTTKNDSLHLSILSH